MMYKILDKGTIKEEVIPHLPRAKRGFQVMVPLEEVVNAIIYKLKSGVQWYLLPAKSFFEEKLLSWQYRFTIITENGVKLTP